MKIDLGLHTDKKFTNYKKSQYGNAYMYKATSKQHLVLKPWKS